MNKIRLEKFTKRCREYIGSRLKGTGVGLLVGSAIALWLPSFSSLIQTAILERTSQFAIVELPKEREIALLLLAAAIAAYLVYKFVVRFWRGWINSAVNPLPLIPILVLPIIAQSSNVYWFSVVLMCPLAAVALDCRFWGRGRKNQLRREKNRLRRDSSSPIKRDWEDRLHRLDLVNRIETLIAEEHQVLALTGDQGDGKSSILELLGPRLRRNPNYELVKFNAWLAANQQELVTGLIDSVRAVVRERMVSTNFQNAAVGLMKLLASTFGKGGATLRFPQEATLATAQREIRNLPFRIIVLIDEIDRLDVSELGGLFKVLRGLSDLRRITFVCALDKTAVALQLADCEQDLPRALRFVEKFFPLQVALSKIDTEILEVAFYEKLRSLRERGYYSQEPEQFNEDFNYVWENAAKRILTNFRKLDLYFSRVETILSLAGAELDLFDLLTLELLQEVAPDVYEAVYRFGYMFYASSTFSVELPLGELAGGANAKADQERMEFYSQMLEKLDFQRRPLVVMLLETLFPNFREAFGTGRITRQSGGEYSRRISHRSFFPRYFTQKAPETKFSVATMDKFILRLGEEGVSTGLKEVVSETRNSPLKFMDFIESIMGRENEIPRGRLSELSLYLFITEPYNPESRVHYRIEALLFHSAQDRTGQEVQEIFERAIKEAALAAAGSLLFSVTKGDQTELPEFAVISGRLDKEKLSELYADRAYKELAEAKVNILRDFDRHSAMNILYRWSQISEHAREQVIAYLDSLFKEDVRLLPKFAGWALPSRMFANRETRDSVATLYPTEKVKLLLESHPDLLENADDAQKWALEFYTAAD